MQIHSIPGKLDVQWDAEVKAMVDTWSSYFVTLDEFRQAVMVKGLNHAKANGVRAWIVDSSRAKGAFPQEIQDFIGKELFPQFVKNGVKYFITITAQSATTRMTVQNYAAKAGPSGMTLVTVGSVEDARAWLRLNDAGGQGRAAA